MLRIITISGSLKAVIMCSFSLNSQAIKIMAIIQSLLDTDLYKFTMLQVVLHQFPAAQGAYEFRCRNAQTVYPLAEIIPELERELDDLCELRLQQDELDYLRHLRFIKSDFVDYMEQFQLKRRFVKIWGDDFGRLNIRIEGPIIQAMFFEIYILAIVNELYFRRLETPEILAEGERRLQEKIAWQKHVLQEFVQAAPEIFRGTSNVYLAKEVNITPIGTMAHEFLQAFQALDVRLRDFQKAALDAWVHEYRGDLGIALTDVVGMDAFLRDFDLYFAKLFDGLRHDSGDPYVWGNKAYEHYKKLKIDSRTKMLTFSDGLDLQKAWDLHQYFKGRFKTSFGIGTNLTNDMGQEPLNIVLKLVECNGQSVAKISDTPGKTVTDNDTFLAYLRQVFQINN